MNKIESLKSYQDIPEPLMLICLKQILKKPVNFFSNHSLPPELGDLIAVAFRDYAIVNRLESKECEKFFRNFTPKHVPISKIDFSYLPITVKFFYEFVSIYRSKLEEINISNCDNLLDINTELFGNLLIADTNNITSSNCKSLIIGGTYERALLEASKFNKPIFPHTLKLKKLVLHNCDSIFKDLEDHGATIDRTLNQILTPMMNCTLKYLDLSMNRVGKGTALRQLEALEVLILYDCSLSHADIIPSTLCHLKSLRVLDISKQTIDLDDMLEYDFSDEQSKLLDLLIKSLPSLTRLDISGTNLVESKERFVSAFEVRVNKPFEFLGLFHTTNEAAYISSIPALTIAGEANESQILNACEAYMDKPKLLAHALNDLYNFYKSITPSETFDDINRALDVVLPILARHIYNEQVIIYTTAALWCIVKINVSSRNLNDAKVRRQITSRLIDAMHYYKSNRVILINGSLTLLFLPDIICEHSRVASISLLMCRDSDPRTQGFGTTLLNSLGCQVGGDQKIFIGNLNAVETMVDIIKGKIERNACDETLETAWSTLWNITDETPNNCDRFLKCGGLEVFEKCVAKFGDNHKEVLRNTLGLLGNVAECKDLRVNFMKDKYIERFFSLMYCEVDGIECNYNACGILAHLISDGLEFWNSHTTINRDRIMRGMCENIASWPINTRRNINYRSFEPIVRLLDVDIAPAAQYWAVFALTNLTEIDPVKYCPMLIPHNGINRLKRLTIPGQTKGYVSDMAKIAVKRYEEYRQKEQAPTATLIDMTC